MNCYEPTNLEQIVSDALTERGIKFAAQFPTTSGFVLDFVIGPNIVIEADGPCHDSSKAKRRDWFRTKCLIMEGWKVFRLNYHIITDPQKLTKELDKILL